MTDALQLSADQARRFLVRRHLLDPPRALPAADTSVLDVVERLGGLQFDPLEVPGARNHDLVLHARIAAYERAWADHWLYGEDRRLIEVYNKSLNILPMSELPHYRLAWERAERSYGDTILREQGEVADKILARIAEAGPLSTAAFRDHNHAVDWWWAPTSAARAVLEALFVTGRLGIARRDGSRRHYDLIERLVPAELLALRESEEDALKHRLWSRFRAVGLMGSSGQAEVLNTAGTAAQRRAFVEQMLADGILLPVEVEGLRGPRFILAEERPILDEPPADQPGVTFVAPLDPIVWDRRLLRELWTFDYLWEVYVPAAKRRWGYYVLPILFGDRFVGRIEPRRDKSSPDLRILGAWFEHDFTPMEEPGFVPALAQALEAYRSFVGARRVTWPRTRAGRELAAAIRRLG